MFRSVYGPVPENGVCKIMEIKRLLINDGSWVKFEADWAKQCDDAGDQFDSYASASLGVIGEAAKTAKADEWAIAVEDDGRIMAVAIAIRTCKRAILEKCYGCGRSRFAHYSTTEFCQSRATATR